MHVAVAAAFLAAFFSILVKVIGLPDQIKNNYQKKSTDGLSVLFVLSAFISYALWTVHGFFQHDKSLIIGQGLGVLTTAIILWQILIYRNNRRKTKISESTWILLPGLFVHHSHRALKAISPRSRKQPKS